MAVGNAVPFLLAYAVFASVFEAAYGRPAPKTGFLSAPLRELPGQHATLPIRRE